MLIPSGFDTKFTSRSEDKQSAETPHPGPSERQQTTRENAWSPTAHTASKKGILMTPDSLKRKHWRELLNLLSEEKRNWWRSSPALYSSGESETDAISPGGTREKRKNTLVPPTPAPKISKINVSGVWPNASDSDWSESEGGEPPPPPPPPMKKFMIC
uniref:ORF3 n=1 Tax=Giant panda anellovirus TaxID=2016460 RepID=A0A220IGH8_9VIRU|nr:ORF3 [Giant panda anellovirus]